MNSQMITSETNVEILIQNKIDYTPKISVIIPVYNDEEYLCECLDSVCNQTLKEIEIICVNDGSTDSSLEFLKEYAAKDNRIIVIDKVKTGAGDSRNIGLKIAQGEYITFLDGDDSIDVKAYKEVYEQMISDEADAGIFGGVMIDFDDEKTKPMPWLCEYSDGVVFPAQEQDEILLKTSPNCWNKVFKRDIIFNNKLMFQNFSNANDVYFSYMAVILSKKISIVNKPYVKYKYNTGSQITTSLKKTDPLNNYYAFKELKQQIISFGKEEFLKDSFYECYSGIMGYQKRTNPDKFCENFATYISLCPEKYQEKISKKFFGVNNVQRYINKNVDADVLVQNSVNYIPKISVVIPVYNVEEYLRECLDSVCNQTLKEIEIICVDDGSTDNSLEILQEYAKKDSRIIVITQKNSGAGVARNSGIKVALGEFVAFMDPDDFYPRKQTLQNVYNKAKENNVNICGGSLGEFKNNKILLDMGKTEYGYVFEKNGILKYKEYQFDYGFTRFIYKLSFLKENQLYFPDYFRGEDPPFFIKAMTLAQNFYALSELTYVYRVSHKEVSWNDRKASDLALSLSDCLTLSYHNGYVKMYCNIAKRICSDYFVNAFSHIENPNVLNSLVSSIDFSLISEEDSCLNLPSFYDDYFYLNDSPKISVIIPIYNVEKYLCKCLDSIINQTLKEIEIICVNDGSTDKSLDIVKEYAEKDKRIQIILQENKGLSAARNTGLKQAHAKYVYFIDSDDYIDKNTLQVLYEAMLVNNTDVVVGTVQCVDENNQLINDGRQIWFDEYLKSSGKCAVPTDIKKDIISTAWNKLYKNAIIKKFNLQFPEGLINEDEYWLWAYMIHCSTYVLANEAVYFYLQRSDSIMGKRVQNKKIMDIIEIHSRIYQYVSQYKNMEIYNPILTEHFITDSQYLLQDARPEFIEEIKQKIFVYATKVNNNDKIRQRFFPSLIIKRQKIGSILKSYLKFPFNLIRLFKLQKKCLLKQLSSARVDIKNIGIKTNNVDVKTVTDISEPTWFKDETGAGKVIEFSALTNTMTIKAINAGKLIISFKGKECCHQGQRFPLWVDYESIKIDGREILSEPISVWHDKPYTFEMPVVDGQIVRVDIKQRYHQYSRKELKKLILKLNPDSVFVKKYAKLLAQVMAAKSI